MRLADYVVSFLAKAGIDRVFTVIGGGCIFLADALGKSKEVAYTACHHEQAAAMAAEGYARAREGLGAVLVTSGPGGTNAITGVAGAWMDHVPTITISGQSFTKQTIVGHPGLRVMGVQEINIVDIVKPITKYAVMVTDPNEIRYHLEKAVYLATTGRPGPVWLDLPADIQNAQIEPESLGGFMPEPVDTKPLAEDAGAVLGLLRKAKRPLVHIGQGVRIAKAIPALFAFLDAAKIPVLTARNGNDLIDSGHELYIGRPGTFAQRGANFAVQTCDLYLAIGTRLSLAQTGYNAKDYARQAKIVMVDIDQPELAKDTVKLEMAVQADARDFLRELIRQSKDKAWPDWSAWLVRCKDRQKRYPPVTDAQLV